MWAQIFLKTEQNSSVFVWKRISVDRAWTSLGKFEMKKFFLCVYILSELYSFYAFTAVEKHNEYEDKIEF